ncbi:hypothetical protein DSM106972_058770 [Dulcicalothrix desertica PCC 7102]|uniref:Glycosyl hydrolase-like 10 domain-containing protein n=2 Tax=Dulcicalothrix desertica TaxID=32056 RepID=A0A3S1CIV2_9CYAN|nr:hypothetical protein DSM106972_058770 [Dulcicalothrix desertica PCC 7102]TWH55383.1 uncharacterized lipoprotein YddW (UPF0748 family) [Dulcicalothrix desertica PCC 7102]
MISMVWKKSIGSNISFVKKAFNWMRLFVTNIKKRLLPLLFLLSFTAVLLFQSFSLPSIAQLPPQNRQEIRGVWLSSNDLNVFRSGAKVQSAMLKLQELNFNTVYPVVWNDGYTKYPSAVLQKKGIPFFFRGAEGQDVFADIIAQARSQGLLAIPWFEFGFMVPLTSELASAHPNWLTQKRDGTQTSISAAGEVAWLNPFHPEVQSFITELITEIMTKYNPDGIQFDDHMSLPVDFGYDKYTINLYTQETGNPPPSNPQAQAWIKWRADKITAFMVDLYQSVKAIKPNAIVSVSPNYYDFAYKFHLQDWLNWVRLGIVDELVMQVYRDDLNSFSSKITRPEVLESQQSIPVGIGIMAGLRGRLVTIAQVQSQVQAAQQRGLGVAFFYYESLWDIAPEPAPQRQSVYAALFPTSRRRDVSQITPRQPTFRTVSLPLFTRPSALTRARGYFLELSSAGGAPRRILLDTGSSGLRVPREFLGNTPIRRTGQTIRETLSDGTILEGELVYAPIRFGLIPTTEPVPIQIVTSRQCTAQRPNCSAKSGTPFSGIIGVNYFEKSLPYNPLRKLPGNLSNGFIITGNSNSNSNSNLTLGLTSENQAGFKMAAWTKQPAINGVEGDRWDSRLGGVCVTIALNATKIPCNARMIVDTATINGSIEVKSAATIGKLKAGVLGTANTLRLAINSVFDYSLTPGNRDGFNRWSLSISPQLQFPVFVNTGIGFLDRFDLLFDPVNGRQGFRPRSQST